MSQQRRQLARSTGTVVVGSKLPHDLILRVFDMVETPTPIMGGGTRMEKVSQERPEKFLINGCAHPQNKAPTAQIVGGFALTYNVPEDLWNLWAEQNKTAMMVKNGLIFAHSQPTSVEDMALEREDVKSGLERLDPDKLPKGLEKSDDMKKRQAA